MTSVPTNLSSAASAGRPLQRNDYTIAIFCPMAIELAPVEALLDEIHQSPLANNSYTLGRIGQHNVIITVMSETGNNSAVAVAVQLSCDFPAVRFGLLVGIGGGIPDERHDIRLGDVVVGQPKDVLGGVVQYDRGKLLTNSKMQRTGLTNKSSPQLNSSIERLKAQHERKGGRTGEYIADILARNPPMVALYSRPGVESDRLFESNYHHQVAGSTCDRCDNAFLKQRPTRPDELPRVHYGTIGSANIVLKDSLVRDALRRDLDVDCVDMESAGLCHALPSVVIRGISDYADSHKSEMWQRYAAAAAAAYAKELLCFIPFARVADFPLVQIQTDSTPSPQTHINGRHTTRQNSPSNDLNGFRGWTQATVLTGRQQRQRQPQQSPPPSEQEFSSSGERKRGRDDPRGERTSALAACSDDLHPQDDRITKTRRVSPITTHDQELSPNREDVRLYLDFLDFDQMDGRYASIDTALAKTCNWILERPELKDWLEKDRIREHGGFLWVKGKPAAGKSTAMKYLLGKAKDKHFADVTVSFFFHARGTNLEKSTEGMYRSLLSQLLKARPDLLSVFTSVKQRRGFGPWPNDELQNAFRGCIDALNQQSLICFIDALDECGEDEVRKMVDFFQDRSLDAAQSGIRFLVCFSSRHFPNISIRIGLQIVLEHQEGHKQDIDAYLAVKLNGRRTKQMLAIRDEISQRAKGVFLWVVMVVKILNPEIDRGRHHKVKQKLDEIPTSLQELFRDILTRDENDAEEMILCLQWVLHARRPLRSEELFHAILSRTDPAAVVYNDGQQAADQESLTETSDKFVLHSSRGLVEKTRGKSPVVQFIHESVREYLLKKDVDARFHIALSSQYHESLKMCCQSYIEINLDYLESYASKEEDNNPKTASREALLNKLPFIGYAVQHVLDHANLAAMEGIDQALFISEFKVEPWRGLLNMTRKFNTRKLQEEASLSFILLSRRCIVLYKSADACRHNNSDPAEILACLDAAIKHDDARLAEELLTSLHLGEEWAKIAGSRSETEWLMIDPDVISQNHKSLAIWKDGPWTPTIRAARYGALDVLKTLLNRKIFHLNDCEKSDGGTALSRAARYGHTHVVEYLLAQPDIDPNHPQLKNMDTPLIAALSGRHEKIARLILNAKGVELSAANSVGFTACMMAAEQGSDWILPKLLLDASAITQRTVRGRNAIHFAARKGRTEVLRILLKACLNSQHVTSTTNLDMDASSSISMDDGKGDTPLMLAAMNAHVTAAKLLLETKFAKVDAINKSGKTALAHAVLRAGVDIAKLLITVGHANVNIGSFQGPGLVKLAMSTDIMQDLEYYLDKDLECCKVDQALSNRDTSELRDFERVAYSDRGLTANSRATISLLLQDAKIDVNRSPEDEWPALHFAICFGVDAVDLLLSYGEANPDARGKYGRSALWIAVDFELVDVVDLLLKTGEVDVEMRADDGTSPLDIAQRLENPRIHNMLLEYMNQRSNVEAEG